VAEIPRLEDGWPIGIDYDGSQILMVFASTDESRTVKRVDQTGEINFDARSAAFWSVSH